MDAAGLALAGKPALVVLALARVVRLDVLLVPLAQLLDRLLDLLDAIVGAHRLGREVAVGARAVPVALHGFRVQGDDHAVFLGDAVQDEPGHPEVVAGGDAEAGSNLKFTQSVNQSRFSTFKNTFNAERNRGTFTWYSHWDGMTSALVPEIATPA